MKRSTRLAALLVLTLGSAGALAQAAAPAAQTVRLRGTVQSLVDDTLVVRDRTGGEVLQLRLPPGAAVNEVFAMTIAAIQPGSFIGTAALPRPDGTRRAIAVMVFPEASRGVGEGDRPFDLMPQSTMTNATVAELLAAPAGRTMRLSHKDGETSIVVPDDAPVVSFRRADRSLLVPGASVSLTAQVVDGKPTVMRISAGRAGFVLPY